MSGRFALTATPDDVAEMFGVGDLEEFPPRYNIAPTQPILLVTAGPRRDPARTCRTAARCWCAGG